MIYILVTLLCTAWLDHRNATRYDNLRKHLLKNDATDDPPPSFIDWAAIAKILSGQKV